MSRKQDIGVCDTCHQQFSYYLIHNGFNDSSYTYCDKCGKTSLLDHWHNNLPKGIKLKYQVIDKRVTSFLKSCDCGGTFKKGASPRCPHCNSVLSAVEATTYIENNAPGSKKGWRWQKNWEDVYCIIIENKLVEDNWKETT